MKIGIIKITATLLLSVFILSNCTVQERKYRKGFYVNVKHKVHKNIESTDKKNPLEVISLNVKAKEEAGSKQELVASIVKTAPPIPKTPLLKISEANNDSCGDFIIMKDGSVFEGRIVELSATEVKFKKCNNLSGPTYTTKRNKVSRIKYANEKEKKSEKIDGPKSINTITPHARNNQQNWNPFAIASLIMGILSFTILLAFITAPLAFVFGIIAHSQINKGKGNRGYGMATFGIIIGIIVIFILVLLLLAMLLV